ncbi:MAG TPA: hypothetical protein VNV37_08370 [Solirubrobacteraceae bacterium]|jgi:hypothetical protein|nr:hypothetical protein [Solirubrobacteraceae bacterium]
MQETPTSSDRASHPRGGRVRRMTAAALVISLLLAAVALAATEAPKAGTYEGTNSEKGPVVLKVAKGGTGVLGFKTAIGYDGKCGQGGGPGFEPEIFGARIKNGRFAVTAKFKGEVPSIPAKQGKVTGRFSGTKVTGTVVIPSLKTKKGCLSYAETYTASWKHK